MNNGVLYHGTTLIVDAPLAGIGRTELDFGPGFYLTRDEIQAEKWARTLAGRKKNASAIVNRYGFDERLFSSSGYRTKIFLEYTLEWLDFIADSRKGKAPWKDYDWIEGGIANDNVISTVDAYVDGFITAEQALDKLVNEELRHQVCISSQDIIDRCLHFLDARNL